MPKSAKIQENWFETLKNKAQAAFGNFDTSYDTIIALATNFGLGFAIGFIIKKFGTFFLFSIIAVILVLYGLQQFDFIVFNIDKFKLFLGFSPHALIHDVMDLYWNWIKNHKVLFMSWGIGFFIGYRLG